MADEAFLSVTSEAMLYGRDVQSKDGGKGRREEEGQRVYQDLEVQKSGKVEELYSGGIGNPWKCESQKQRDFNPKAARSTNDTAKPSENCSHGCPAHARRVPVGHFGASKETELVELLDRELAVAPLCPSMPGPYRCTPHMCSHHPIANLLTSPAAQPSRTSRRV